MAPENRADRGGSGSSDGSNDQCRRLFPNVPSSCYTELGEEDHHGPAKAQEKWYHVFCAHETCRTLRLFDLFASLP